MGDSETPKPAAVSEDRLRQDVEFLSLTLGERNLWHYAQLGAAADYIEAALHAAGLSVARQEFSVQGRTVCNLEAEIAGTAGTGELLIIGAHYDSRCGQLDRAGQPTGPGTPGADDNATGVAATLELARTFAGHPQRRSLRFVFFVNEEPPFFQTDQMGSTVYARRCRARGERIVGVLTPDTLGYYRQDSGSQRYRFPYTLCGYPKTGNFVALLSDFGSRRFLRRTEAAFRLRSDFPCLAVAVPAVVRRIGWSDDWSFWRQGYPALTVTDTAYLRTPYYHTVQDTPDKLDFASLASVVTGLQGAVADLAGA
jgi:Zn-dependent M28 family amino/carboxypeptidase